jgi:hypothetical protein
MQTTRRVGLVLAGLVLTLPLRAQVPAVPGAPPLPGGPVPPATGAATTAAGATPAAAAPKNIWSFFMKTPEQKAQCKSHFCNSRIGQFFNNMMLPAGLATGGMLGPICPGPNAPNPADIAKPATSAQGAAAKIKAEEAQAKAKIAAIEYLATVDCRYYPEAEAALINGLRAEKNECVRLAAAKAFASGCCCSAKVVKALTISVNCSTADKFPAEASELVRTYAYVALERCLRKCIETEPEVPPEPPPAAKKAMYETLVPMGTIPDYNATILLASYYALDASDSPLAVFAAARQTLSRGLQLSQHTLARLSGPRNVRDIMFPESVKPVSFSMPKLVQEQPRQYTLNVSGPVEPGQPVPVTHAEPVQPEQKPGRGNLLNIAQEAWRK